MANIVIETGLEEFVLQTKNGKETSIFYNPTDATFIEKVFSAFESLDEQQEAFQKKIENAAGEISGSKRNSPRKIGTIRKQKLMPAF